MLTTAGLAALAGDGVAAPAGLIPAGTTALLVAGTTAVLAAGGLAGAFAGIAVVGTVFTICPAVAGAVDVPTATGIAAGVPAGMQLAAPATFVAGVVAFFLPKIDLRLAICAMAFPAVLVVVLVAFAVCWPPTEFAVPVIAFTVFAALPEGPHGGKPAVPPASMGDAPATPAVPSGAPPPEAKAEPVMPLASP